MNNKPLLFDSHAHYDHPSFKSRGPEIIKELREKGLDKVVIPAITFDSNCQVRKMFPKDEYPFVYFAAGIHPKVISRVGRFISFAESVRNYCDDERTVAIKTGLDFSNDNLTGIQIAKQKEAMDILMEIADSYELPLVFHIRDAYDESINIFKQKDLRHGAVVHCFNASYDVYQAYMDVGITHIGIGGAVTYEQNAELRECVRKMPLEMIVLETDAPFQKPVGWLEGPNTSLSLYQIAEAIADIKGLSRDELIEETYKNASALYRLK